MKQFFLTLFVLLSVFQAIAQSTTSKAYTAQKVILTKPDGSTSSQETLVHIDFVDPEQPEDKPVDTKSEGRIDVIFLKVQKPPMNFAIRFMKKSKEKIGVMYWYEIIDNNQEYDVVKICKLSKAALYRGYKYDTKIILSKYAEESSPRYESCLLSNNLAGVE